MKSTTVKNRSMASALALVSAAIFGMAGIAHAQYGGSSSGQGSNAAQSGSSAGQSGSAGKTPSESESLKEGKAGMDQGQVDQQKRNERNKDAASPSRESHVPDFPRDKEGKPMKDLKDEQGGPIGPN
ncbi:MULTISPECIES: hypothetical protein [unclassified Nitrosospira]|jgi:hypothetical protein|uniref:hypothetical protein n=1 Tax=unclassified Nitrosospira TaxID=2609267 RepID=UPI000D2FAC87|nr:MULTISPECIES: hypothetical protein [unclassified Nitrosospira]PTR16508.1 hypothetical protein C8R31_102525 [Nitrosospira sp. Nsp2]WON73451.1 hypothetical protein R5L00_13360 [Nitrosospira sp. Is2]